MTCKHPHIIVWRLTDSREPAGMWSCSECNLKFVPFDELGRVRKETAQACIDIIGCHSVVDDRHEKMIADIRAEYPEAFT